MLALVETTTEARQQESIDIDNYMSPHPNTSSSHKQPMIASLPRNDSTAGKLVSAGDNRAINHPTIPTKNHKSNDARSSSKQQQHSSKIDATSSTQTTAQLRAAATSATTTSALASASLKEKRLEAIRQRMESCLTAITNKVTDEAQRSRLAPFLAYLGTKLENVPKEILPNLEREILEMVTNYSK